MSKKILIIDDSALMRKVISDIRNVYYKMFKEIEKLITHNLMVAPFRAVALKL